MKDELCKDIERACGRKMQCSKDFEWLAKDVESRVSSVIGVNTLKRLWGYYSDHPFNPRKGTLDVLAQYVGFENFELFCISRDPNYVFSQSNFVLSKRLDVSDLKSSGVNMLLSWLPDRRVLVRYHGNFQFEVLEVENSKLNVGDTFECHLIMEGEPLYLGNLRHNNPDGSVWGPIAYVAGKNGGVKFEIIDDLTR